MFNTVKSGKGGALSSSDLSQRFPAHKSNEHPRRGRVTGREVLIVMARHASEHMGQALLTRDLLLVARGKTPPNRTY